jgi:glutamate racemase
MHIQSHTIGVLDSGLGGISVLNELIQNNTAQRYLYYGDLFNSPYGEKSVDEVYTVTKEATQFLFSKGVDAVVLACNTATSAAAGLLREEYPNPIFGMEPAIKPAIQNHFGDKIAVFATSLTLNEKKFNSLLSSLDANNRVIKIGCDGLAKLIDLGNNQQIENYMNRLSQQIQGHFSAVLGCTHYVLVKDIFQKTFPDAVFYDGNWGTVKHIKNSLYNNEPQKCSSITIYLHGGSFQSFELCLSHIKNLTCEVNLCKIHQHTKTPEWIQKPVVTL